MTDYVPPVDISKLKEDVDDWLTVTKHNGERVGETKYFDDLHHGACAYLRREWSRPGNLPAKQEWVRSGVWMRGKAGTGGQTLIEIDGK
ncbi:hypothetical protein JYU34_000598 [Plutella xylostella]|uniref:Uncharacterized protein n=1 Tax=Plutella xylostella TaxID=51655 RepID=A0ABQ7R8C6_PLUXY|nr:hypothetical protein JYU34_000598 [Plutella xylostella]